MKKITAIIAIFILSLMNGFANTDHNHDDYDHMKHIAKNLNSVLLISLLNDAIEECPDLVTTVIHEQQKNLTLDQILTINKKLAEQIKEFENAHEHDEEKESDEIQSELLLQELRTSCLKHGINLPSRDLLFDGEDDDCLGSTQAKRIIECILKSYCPDLLVEAGRQFYKFSKEEL